MKFNCSVMHIGHNNCKAPTSCLINMQLPSIYIQRDLGIAITKDLKWKKETEKSCRMMNRVLGLITPNFRYKNK